MKRINMLSKADMVKGQGVLSAHDEQVELVREVMESRAVILENAKVPCEITHYHSINPEYYISTFRKKREGALVGYVHFLPETVENSIYLPRFAKNAFYKYMISFYKRMDYLVTVNPVFIDRLADYGIPKEKIAYIPNVVSEKNFYPVGERKKREARKKYGIRQEAFTVLCAGQLQKRKGVFDFLDIAEKMPECEFVWAGGFSFGRISEGYEEIKTRMEKLPKNVKYLGLVEREEMNEIYNMSDVMFLPSYEELFPMTILEAMNCRLPVLVRNLEVYRPILFDYVLRGKDQKEFIKILERLKNDPEFYKESAESAFTGHKFYSREHVGKMWKIFYERVFQEEGEKNGAESRHSASDGSVILWEDKKQQYI